jgi:glyceraldehyde-3-phosphate dehydrogenase (ferredoxin)
MDNQPSQRSLTVDVSDDTTSLASHAFPDVIGPVDFVIDRVLQSDCMVIGSGVLAGSIIPGSNRLVVAGRSPVWGGFYVSTVGGASLIWDGIGISFLTLTGRADKPSALVLSGKEGEDPRARLVPLDLETIWDSGDERHGFYALQQHVFDNLWEHEGTPRVLATGTSALRTDFGAIGSSKTHKGKLTAVDGWAGRGGMGSLMLKQHNVCAIIYGGDFEDEDLTDRAEADGYFKDRFSKKMKLVDLEKTTKYRFDPKWASGGTFGVNYSKLSELMLSFNYRSVSWSPERRMDMWKRLVRDHYLKQFNEETIAEKQQTNCGEPCAAVCKKNNGPYKKDYEPYAAMGPLIGVFDQRSAERINHHADAHGFDGIQIGGQLAWLMECLHDGVVDAQTLGLPGDVPEKPVFDPDDFDPVASSQHNEKIAMALIDLTATPGHLLSKGMRAAAKVLGSEARDRSVYIANGEHGWIVPNQYWVPGMFSPAAIMGKYYVYYGFDFHQPSELGRKCGERLIAELTLDNAGMCRFHRGWAEELWADIVTGHYGLTLDYVDAHAKLAKRVHATGAPRPWESARVEEIIHRYLAEVQLTTSDQPALDAWLKRFDEDRSAAAKAYWEDIKSGMDEFVSGT